MSEDWTISRDFLAREIVLTFQMKDFIVTSLITTIVQYRNQDILVMKCIPTKNILHALQLEKFSPRLYIY